MEYPKSQSPSSKNPAPSTTELRRRAQNRNSQRTFRARKQIHIEELQSQVYTLQKANHHLIEANDNCVAELSGLSKLAEGLDLEINLLQVHESLQEGQEPWDAALWSLQQPKLEEASSYFSPQDDTFGFNTSFDFATGRSDLSKATERQLAFAMSQETIGIGTEMSWSGTTGEVNDGSRGLLCRHGRPYAILQGFQM